MKKRLLSILLALVMLFSALPVHIAAAEESTEVPSEEETTSPGEEGSGEADPPADGLLRTHLRAVNHPTHLKEGSVSVFECINRNPNPGLLSYEKGTPKTTGSVKLQSWSIDGSGKVTYTLSGAKDGDTVTLPVTIHSELYGKDTLEVVITIGYAALTLTNANTVTFGSALKLTCAGLRGKGAVIYSITAGTDYATINGDTLVPLKVGTVTIRATQVTDGTVPTHYSETMTITITKADPFVIVGHTALERAGQTLAEAGLKNKFSAVPGRLEWVLSDRTLVLANVEYEWIFTPDDTQNYNRITGTVTPYVVADEDFAIGSGTTVLNRDGSYTTVSYGEDDSRYELTEYPDGSMRMVHRQLDGTVVTTVLEADRTRTKTTEFSDGSVEITARCPNGMVHSTRKDRYGRTDVQVSLPFYLTESYVKKNEAIVLPIPELPGTDNRADAPTIVFTISTKKAVRVCIPINNPSAGTVAVLVAKDGQETVVKTSITGKDCVYVTLTGSTTVKVVNLGRSFKDVNRNDWFYSSVEFVTARGLFRGMDAITFAPTLSMSRAMVVQLLHNMEGNPYCRTYRGFSDIENTWYETAASWATYSGFIVGHEDGTFRGDDNITREQLAVILYRYAGYPSISNFVNTPFYDYYDYNDISPYAWNAMYWALNSGVLYTSGRNNLAPQQDATRAEVAWAIQRLMEYLA